MSRLPVKPSSFSTATSTGSPWQSQPPLRGTWNPCMVLNLGNRSLNVQGFHVPRKGGWDSHGLPVEVAVEKELGFTGKRDIEAYGVAEFNARCRESVLRHVDAWLEMSRRMGYWADFDHAYQTVDAGY